MSGTHLVGRCGLYCGACSIYRAERDSVSWQQELADRFQCQTGQLRCNGCRNLSVNCWGNKCKLVRCLTGKGLDNCYECCEVSNCADFNRLSNGYRQDGVNLLYNLREIHAVGLESWAAKMKQEYTCRSCGNPFNVGGKQCRHCRESLSRRDKGTG